MNLPELFVRGNASSSGPRGYCAEVDDDIRAAPCAVERDDEGWKRVEIATYLGVSPARVTQILDRIAESYVDMFGVPGFEYRACKQQKRRPGRQPGKRRAVA